MSISPLVADPEVVVEATEVSETQKYTHIINPTGNPQLDGPGITASDIVQLSMQFGIEIVALCGYRWVPTSFGEKFDACPICMDVAQMLMRNAGE